MKLKYKHKKVLGIIADSRLCDRNYIKQQYGLFGGPSVDQALVDLQVAGLIVADYDAGFRRFTLTESGKVAVASE